MGGESVQKKNSKYLKLIYLAISIILIYVEYLKDPFYLYIFKPLLMPLLCSLYFVTAKHKNKYFVLALLFMWLANIFFIGNQKGLFILGALNTFISRVFVLVFVLKAVNRPKFVPFAIASVPFLMIFITVLELISENLGEAFYFYIVNGLLVIILGGIALANYFHNSNRINTYLLISVILFTAMQFLVAVDVYYISVDLFRPIVIIMYSVAQYVFYKAALRVSKKQHQQSVIQ